MCTQCHQGAGTISRRGLIRLAGIGAGGVALASGARRRGGAQAQSTSEPAAASGEHAATWSYEGETGPAHWGDLEADFALCSRGHQQSPIDITQPTGEDLADIAFAYQPAPALHLVNNGHTVQVNVPAGNAIVVDGTRYELKQFHFHYPSEHTIAGQAQAMELHLVHIADDQTVAVVGALLKEGTEHAGLNPIFAALPDRAGAERELAMPFDLMALLPATRSTYRYLGSLTTPPCSEGVHWLLFTEPEEVSPAQVAAFHTLFARDARPVQPRDGRLVQEDASR